MPNPLPINRSWAGLLRTSVFALGLVLVLCASGAEYDEVQTSGWSFRVGASLLFNVRASIEADPTPVAQGRYDNGFVVPDVNGTVSGQTWNWGYQESGQVVGNEVRFSRVTDVPIAGLYDKSGGDPAFGGEIFGMIELGRFQVGQREARMGFELGGAYHTFSMKNTSTASGTAVVTVDGYGLGGTVPPVPPYSGTFNGPGPLINLNPSSSGSFSSPVQTSYDGELTSDLYNFKAGVWFEYPMTQRLTVGASLGYSSIYGDTQLRYTESFSFDDPSIPDVPPTQQTVGGRDWKAGVYTQLRLQYYVTPRLAAYLAGGMEYHANFGFSGQQREITLFFGPLFATSAGLSFSF